MTRKSGLPTSTQVISEISSVPHTESPLRRYMPTSASTSTAKPSDQFNRQAVRLGNSRKAARKTKGQ